MSNTSLDLEIAILKSFLQPIVDHVLSKAKTDLLAKLTAAVTGAHGVPDEIKATVIAAISGPIMAWTIKL